MKVAGGSREDGVVYGNAYDKYGSGNPLVRHIMAGFEQAVGELARRAAPSTLHEVGCGEGYWTLRWAREGLAARGSDASSEVIELARANAREAGVDPGRFERRSIYEMQPERDGADLVVCCEVLEHLERPDDGLAAIAALPARHWILSVPREPLWRVLNVARGKYLGDFGNTPGHLQHWSRRAFLDFVSRRLEILEVRSPVPWTVVLCGPRR